MEDVPADEDEASEFPFIEDHASAPVTPAVPAASIVDQIKRLAELRDSGILTDGEFRAKKAELLARM